MLVGALSTAIAMMTSVGIMVGSFRQTVQLWMDNQLKADLLLRPARSVGADRHPTIDATLADTHRGAARALPGWTAFALTRSAIRGCRRRWAADKSGDHRPRRESLSLGPADPGSMLARLRSGDNVVVSEPFANKHHVRAGDTLTLPLGGQHGRVSRDRCVLRLLERAGNRSLMDRSTMLQYLPDRRRRTLPCI